MESQPATSKAKNRSVRFLVVGLALLCLGALLRKPAQNSSELVTLVPLQGPPAYLFRWTEGADANEGGGTKVEDFAMFPDERECREFLRAEADDLRSRVAQERAKDPKMAAQKSDLRCIPESDPTVGKEWRSPLRRLGKWRRFDHGYSVYYYHEPEPLALAGAYVLAIPGEKRFTAEISTILVDQRGCEARLAMNKETWRDDRDFERAAEHDPSPRADVEKYKRFRDRDRREARGACIPIASAKRLLENYCDGLPLRLNVVGGVGAFSCDFVIVNPSP